VKTPEIKRLPETHRRIWEDDIATDIKVTVWMRGQNSSGLE